MLAAFGQIVEKTVFVVGLDAVSHQLAQLVLSLLEDLMLLSDDQAGSLRDPICYIYLVDDADQLCYLFAAVIVLLQVLVALIIYIPVFELDHVLTGLVEEDLVDGLNKVKVERLEVSVVDQLPGIVSVPQAAKDASVLI